MNARVTLPKTHGAGGTSCCGTGWCGPSSATAGPRPRLPGPGLGAGFRGPGKERERQRGQQQVDQVGQQDRSWRPLRQEICDQRTEAQPGGQGDARSTCPHPHPGV